MNFSDIVQILQRYASSHNTAVEPDNNLHLPFQNDFAIYQATFSISLHAAYDDYPPDLKLSRLFSAVIPNIYTSTEQLCATSQMTKEIATAQCFASVTTFLLSNNMVNFYNRKIAKNLLDAFQSNFSLEVISLLVRHCVTNATADAICEKLVICAAISGNLAVFQALCDNHYGFSEQYASLLHITACNHDVAMAKLLIANGWYRRTISGIYTYDLCGGILRRYMNSNYFDMGSGWMLSGVPSTNPLIYALARFPLDDDSFKRIFELFNCNDPPAPLGNPHDCAKVMALPAMGSPEGITYLGSIGKICYECLRGIMFEMIKRLCQVKISDHDIRIDMIYRKTRDENNIKGVHNLQIEPVDWQTVVLEPDDMNCNPTCGEAEVELPGEYEQLLTKTIATLRQIENIRCAPNEDTFLLALRIGSWRVIQQLLRLGARFTFTALWEISSWKNQRNAAQLLALLIPESQHNSVNIPEPHVPEVDIYIRLTQVVAKLNSCSLDQEAIVRSNHLALRNADLLILRNVLHRLPSPERDNCMLKAFQNVIPESWEFDELITDSYMEQKEKISLLDRCLCLIEAVQSGSLFQVQHTIQKRYLSYATDFSKVYMQEIEEGVLQAAMLSSPMQEDIIHYLLQISFFEKFGRNTWNTIFDLNDQNVLRLLLDNVGDTTCHLVSGKYMSGISVLSLALQRNDSALVDMILEASVDPNWISDYVYVSPLKLAIKNDNIHLVNRLLDTGANPLDHQALCSAVESHNGLEFMETIFAKLHSAFPNHSKISGAYALCLAILMQKVDLVQYLVKQGVPLNKYFTPSYMNFGHIENTMDIDGDFQVTVTGWAIGYDNTADLSSIKCVIENGGDFNRILWRSRDGDLKTGLELAVERSNSDMFEMLIYAGCKIDPPAGDCCFGTPLQRAVFAGDTEIVQRLLQLGANPNRPGASDLGLSPLAAAASRGFINIARLLIEAGADVNAFSRIDWRPSALVSAATNGRIDMIQLLVDNGVLLTGADSDQFEGAVRRARNAGHFAAERLLQRLRDEQLFIRLSPIS
jgi:ankyrin repeat protein